MNRTDTATASRPQAREADRLAIRVKRRLNESRLRTRLRGRPRLQGLVLAPAGIHRRLPTAAGLYFPFYHDVPARFAKDLRRHLNMFREIGPMISWDEALDVLAGRRELTGPTFCLSFDDCHPTWRDVVVPTLREMDVPATFFLTSGMVGPGNLSWQDCRDIAAAGFAFGSHTCSHRRLSDLDDVAAIQEIRGSKADIEDKLGVEIRDFAAPYGQPGVDFLDRDVRLVQESGYRSFATTLRAAMHSGDTPMWIQRQGLHPAWPEWAIRTRVHD